MSKNLRNDYLRLYPHLFEKQICKICGKEFYLSYERIKGIVRSIKVDKNFVFAYLLEGFKIFCILNPNEHTCEEHIFYDSGYIILYYNQPLLPYLH